MSGPLSQHLLDSRAKRLSTTSRKYLHGHSAVAAHLMTFNALYYPSPSLGYKNNCSSHTIPTQQSVEKSYRTDRLFSANETWLDPVESVKESAVHHHMYRDAGGIAQPDSPYPSQVGIKRIDAPCLSHERHARGRPDGQQRSADTGRQRYQQPLTE